MAAAGAGTAGRRSTVATRRASGMSVRSSAPATEHTRHHRQSLMSLDGSAFQAEDVSFTAPREQNRRLRAEMALAREAAFRIGSQASRGVGW